MVPVVSRRYMAPGQGWCSGRITYQQALISAELGESTGHSPAKSTG
jgi:hypothetical protein